MSESNLPPGVKPEDVDEAMGALDAAQEADIELADEMEALAEELERVAQIEPKGEEEVTRTLADTENLIAQAERVAKMLRAREIDKLRSGLKPCDASGLLEMLDQLIEAAAVRVKRLGFLKRAYLAKFIREVDP